MKEPHSQPLNTAQTDNRRGLNSRRAPAERLERQEGMAISKGGGYSRLEISQGNTEQTTKAPPSPPTTVPGHMENKVYRAGFTKCPPPHPQHYSVATPSVDQAALELWSTCPCPPSVGIKGMDNHCPAYKMGQDKCHIRMQAPTGIHSLGPNWGGLLLFADSISDTLH